MYVRPPNQGTKQINTEITKLMTFMKQTMQTLLVYYEKLKTFLNTDQTHFEIL